MPQLTNLGLKGKNGGLTVYYIPPYDGVTNVTAPPPVCILFFLKLGLDMEWRKEADEWVCLGISNDCGRSNVEDRCGDAETALSSLHAEYCSGSVWWRAVYRE